MIVHGLPIKFDVDIRRVEDFLFTFEECSRRVKATGDLKGRSIFYLTVRCDVYPDEDALLVQVNTSYEQVLTSQNVRA